MDIANTGLRPLAAMTTIVVLAIVIGMIVASGSSDGTEKATASGPDLAFANDMADHHQAAIAVAKIAGERSESSFVRDIAAQIVKQNTAEIRTLLTIRRELIERGFHRVDIGNSERVREIDLKASLDRRVPFHRAFADAMTRHQQRAVRLARVQVARGQHQPLVRAARNMKAVAARQVGHVVRSGVAGTV